MQRFLNPIVSKFNPNFNQHVKKHEARIAQLNEELKEIRNVNEELKEIRNVNLIGSLLPQWEELKEKKIQRIEEELKKMGVSSYIPGRTEVLPAKKEKEKKKDEKKDMITRYKRVLARSGDEHQVTKAVALEMVNDFVKVGKAAKEEDFPKDDYMPVTGKKEERPLEAIPRTYEYYVNNPNLGKGAVAKKYFLKRIMLAVYRGQSGNAEEKDIAHRLGLVVSELKRIGDTYNLWDADKFDLWEQHIDDAIKAGRMGG